MKKLYLLLDEWDNDRNFVGGELEKICERYDVTVICNSANVMLNPGAKYAIYKRPGKAAAIVSLIRMIFDRDAWTEAGRVMREDANRTGRLSEAVRFYINADLFGTFMKKNGYFEDNAIYYSYWYFWKCYAITRRIDKLKGSRVITRTHEYDLYDYTSPSGYQPFKESMDRKLDKIIFIAEHGRDYYLKKYGYKACDKYKLCRLGTIDPYKTGDMGIFQAHGRTDTLTLVSCSSVIPRKRVKRIAEALALIEDVKIKWIHFGAGDLFEELKEACHILLDDKPRIEYELKGYVKNEDLHDFYAKNRVDLFVSTSSSEGNPVSVMEALSYGIPVIAPSVCNFPNMIKDCGMLISQECTPAELAGTIAEFAKLPDYRVGEFRTGARKCYEEKFNADVNIKRFTEEVLDTL